MGQRKTGHLVTYKMDDDNNGSYTEVGQVISINGANVIDVGEVDATVLTDPISPYMIPPTVNGYPPVVIVVALDPSLATHVTLRAITEARTSHGAQVVFNNYSPVKTWQCSTGYNSKFETGEITSKGLMICTITYRPQTLPTLS